MSLETINILSKNCCGFFWISATFYVNVWSNCQPLCLRSRQFCKRPTTIRQQHQTIFRSKVNITRFILNVTYLDSIALYFPRFSDKTKLNVNKMKWDYITKALQFFHIKSTFWNHLIIKDFYVQRPTKAVSQTRQELKKTVYYFSIQKRFHWKNSQLFDEILVICWSSRLANLFWDREIVL